MSCEAKIIVKEGDKADPSFIAGRLRQAGAPELAAANAAAVISRDTRGDGDLRVIYKPQLRSLTSQE